MGREHGATVMELRVGGGSIGDTTMMMVLYKHHRAVITSSDGAWMAWVFRVRGYN